MRAPKNTPLIEKNRRYIWMNTGCIIFLGKHPTVPIILTVDPSWIVCIWREITFKSWSSDNSSLSAWCGNQYNIGATFPRNKNGEKEIEYEWSHVNFFQIQRSSRKVMNLMVRNILQCSFLAFSAFFCCFFRGWGISSSNPYSNDILNTLLYSIHFLTSLQYLVFL